MAKCRNRGEVHDNMEQFIPGGLYQNKSDLEDHEKLIRSKTESRKKETC